MKMAPATVSPATIPVMVMASSTCPEGMVRLNTVTELLPLALAIKNSSSTITVTVLIPPAVEPEEPIKTEAIDNYIANGISLDGTWYGQISPGYSHITAYPTQLIISGNTATLLVSDSYSHQLASYPLTLSRDGCIIDFYISEPITYSIETPEKTLNFEYNDIMEGIIVFTEEGTFLQLNVFTSQIFEK